MFETDFFDVAAYVCTQNREKICFRAKICPNGGDEEDRTPDPLLARQVLSQLSYTPIFGVPAFCSPVSCLPLIKKLTSINFS